MEIIGKDKGTGMLTVKMLRDEMILYKKMFGTVQRLFQNACHDSKEDKSQKTKKSRKPRSDKGTRVGRSKEELDEKNLANLDTGKAGEFFNKKIQ